MKNQELYYILINKLNGNSCDVMELRNLLLSYKEMGVNQTEMFETLSTLRGLVDENDEEIILDLLDFVTGFCNPSLKIYK